LNLHHYQKTQRLALIDGLPGLYNKDIFMEFLRKDTLKKLIDRIDQTLYRAKRSGKNRIEVSLKEKENEQIEQ